MQANIIKCIDLVSWNRTVFEKEVWFDKLKHHIPKTTTSINVGVLSPFAYQFSCIALGHLSIYHHLNQNPSCPAIADRVFVYDPLSDSSNFKLIPNITLDKNLTSFERSIPLKDLDVICISLTTPENIIVCLELLRLGGIPILAKERKGGYFPIIMAGGPGICNPEVFADFIDIACIGDGCIATERVCEIVHDIKRMGEKVSINAIFDRCNQIPGIFFCEKYDFKYFGQDITSIEPCKHAPERITRAVDDFFSYNKSSLFSDGQTGVIVPNSGCKFKCSYCVISEIQYGESSVEYYIERVRLMLRSGISNIIINSATITQYSQLNLLLDGISVLLEEEKRDLKFFVGSVRFDELSMEVLGKLNKLDALSHTYLLYTKGKSDRFMALAPEHGSAQLLKKVNRNLDPWKILNVIDLVKDYQIYNFVLYFLIGIESETFGDRKRIADLCIEILNRIKTSNGNLIIKINPLIPTPGTACQRLEMISYKKYIQYVKEIKDIIKSHFEAGFFEDHVEIVLLPEERLLFEMVVSRGDRRLGSLIIKTMEMSREGRNMTARNYTNFLKKLGFDIKNLRKGKLSTDILPWMITDQASPSLERKVLDAIRNSN